MKFLTIHFVTLLSFLCIMSLFCNISWALNVDWIPSDPDGPLPLSTKFRDSLRKLCEIIEKKDKQLPPELTEKKAILVKLCARLRADDSNISYSDNSAVSSKRVMLVLLGLGGGYFIWTNLPLIKTWVNTAIRKVRGASIETVKVKLLDDHNN